MVFLLIQVRRVQVYAGHKVAEYLSSKLNTKVVIGSVDIEFFKKIVLEDIYIEDLHQDTLLYAKKLKVDISKLDFEKHQLFVSSIMLLNTKSKLISYANEDQLNLQFIIDLFVGSDTTVKTPSQRWEIKF